MHDRNKIDREDLKLFWGSSNADTLSVLWTLLSECMAFETTRLYFNVNMKPSNPCNIKVFINQMRFGAFCSENVVSFQIFHIFHHSNVFVIVKRLAENYVNSKAFDMYKFGCFENQHFSRLKTAEPV